MNKVKGYGITFGIGLAAAAVLVWAYNNNARVQKTLGPKAAA